MRPESRSPRVELPIATSDGTFIAHYSSKGLASLDFPNNGQAGAAKADDAPPIPANIREWHRITTVAIKRTLAGRPAGTLPPFDLSAGTDFQRGVWRALTGIQAGQTRSYGEIAQSLGKPKAMRAVGGACGANPIPVLVPCHRVLAANRKISGFGGGLDWKRKLLAREGVAVK